MTFKKLLTGLSAAITLSALVGCASTPPASSVSDTASLGQVEAGKQGMILMSNSGQHCDTSYFDFENQDTEKTTRVKIVQVGRRSIFRSGEPAMIAMEPGTYKLVYGNCSTHPYQTIGYSGLDRWFEPFTIEGGEVRYIGHLSVSAAKGEGRQGLATAAIGRVLNMGRSTNKPRDYLVVRMIDVPEAAKTALDLTYPDLVKKFKSDPLTARIDANEFRKVVRDAYSADENGKEPMISDANKIVVTYLESFDTEG